MNKYHKNPKISKSLTLKAKLLATNVKFVPKNIVEIKLEDNWLDIVSRLIKRL
jgi:hypothetical protein